MITSPFSLIVLALGTWWVSHAVTKTHGPFHIFEWARKHLPHGGLLDCPVCLSVWVAAALYLTPFSAVHMILAVAGLAMLAHGYSGWRHG